MEIRPLRETDSRLEISRIYEESWRSAYRGLVPQAYLDGIPAGHWAEALDRADWTTLVMLDGGKPVGTSSVGPSRWPEHPEFGEIVSLYLLPEYMGRAAEGRCWRRRSKNWRAGDSGISCCGCWKRTAGPGASMRSTASNSAEPAWRAAWAGSSWENCCTAAVRRPAGPSGRTAVREDGGACRRAG